MSALQKKALCFLCLFSILFIGLLPAAAQPPIQWQKALGGGNDDDARDFIHTTDGGYVAVGTAISPDGDVTGNHGFVDYWVVKVNASGALQWQKALGGSQSDVAHSVQQTRDGGYIVAGYATSPDGQVTGHHGYTDAWIVKLDAGGVLQWQKALGGTSFDDAGCVLQTADGGFIVAGHTSSTDGDVSGFRGGTDAWVVKLDAGGALQWQKTYGGSAIDDFSAIAAVGDGYILVGYTTSTDGQVSGQHGGADIWVVRIDSQGVLQWQKTLGGSGTDTGADVLATADGGCILAANTSSVNGDVSGNHGSSDYWVARLDATGTIQWQKCYGGTAEDMVSTIRPTPDNGYVLGGNAASTNGDVSGNKGGGDLWVVKITATGAIEWQKCYGGNRMEYVGGVVPTSDGWYAAGCATNSTAGDVTGLHGLSFDVWIVKLGPDPRCSPTLTTSVTRDTICNPGDPVTFTATVTNGGTNAIYRWKKNNTLVGTNSPTYIPTRLLDGDVVVCEYSCRTACDRDTTLTSVPIKIAVINMLEPVVTVAASATVICPGTPVTFTATPQHGHMVPSYQWLVNGAPTGTNSTIFTAPNLPDKASVVCIMTVSHPSCQGSTKDYSDPIAITVNPIITPSVTVSASATRICKGSSVTFTASGTGGTRPAYQWKVNGTNAGANSATFTTATLDNGDVVTCHLTADPATPCLNGTTATSQPLTMEVKQVTLPTVSITASETDVCAGTPVTFTALVQNAGVSPVFQWQVNGTAAGSGSPTFTSSGLSDGDKVLCLLSTSSSECPNSVSASNTEVVSVRPVPAISFTPATLTVMSGQSAQLNASVSGSIATYSWTPAAALADAQTLTPTTTALAANTTYTLSVTATNGCTAAKDITVQVMQQLYMPNSFTPNDDGINDVFRIPPGVALQLDEFSVFDRWGNRVFTTRQPAESWTGKRGGVLQPAGTYVYLLRGKDNNGPVLLRGIVTLIR